MITITRLVTSNSVASSARHSDRGLRQALALHGSLIEAHWFIMRITWNSRQTGPVVFSGSQNSVYSVWILRIRRPISIDSVLGYEYWSCPQSICNFFFIRGLSRSHILLCGDRERSCKSSDGDSFEHTFLLTE